MQAFQAHARKFILELLRRVYEDNYIFQLSCIALVTCRVRDYSEERWLELSGFQISD